MNGKEEELKNYYISEDLVLHLIQNQNSGNLYLFCDMYDNGDFYTIKFKLCENELKIVDVETSFMEVKGITYDDIVNNVYFDDNKVEITLDSSYEFDEEHLIKLNFNKTFNLEKIDHVKFDIFDKLDNKFSIRYIEELMGIKDVYGKYEFAPEYINGLLNYFEEILNRRAKISFPTEDIKIDIEEIIKMAQEFLYEMNIDINIYDLLTEQAITFKTEFDGRKGDGVSSYDEVNNKKIISVNKTDDIKMAAVLVHELLHYYNQPDDNNRNVVSDFLTESISYGYQLIFLDKYLESIYKTDTKDMMIAIFVSLISKSTLIYPAMCSVQFYNNKELTIETIERNGNLEAYFRTMRKFIKERYTLSKELWTIIGYHLGIYCYIEYKKDPLFVNKLLEFNNSINTKSFMECLSIIGLNNIKEIFDKGMTNLDEYIVLIKSYEEEQNKIKTLTLK